MRNLLKILQKLCITVLYILLGYSMIPNKIFNRTPNLKKEKDNKNAVFRLYGK